MWPFRRLFRKKPTDKFPSILTEDDIPTICGGDALSVETPATINCAAMSTAHLLINKFISERHGQKDTDWEAECEFFVNEPNIPKFTVRAFGITTKSGGTYTYYFDVARPMNATKRLVKMMGLLPDDIQI
jgi:hypothetical protein